MILSLRSAYKLLEIMFAIFIIILKTFIIVVLAIYFIVVKFLPKNRNIKTVSDAFIEHLNLNVDHV